MRVAGLGKIVAQPTRNEEGTLVYFQTDHGLGVHIDVDTGVAISVEDLKSGMIVQSEGTDAEDYTPTTVTLDEAMSERMLVSVNTRQGSRLVGYLSSIERSYPGWTDEPPNTEVTVILQGGAEATVYGDSITSIVRMI